MANNRSKNKSRPVLHISTKPAYSDMPGDEVGGAAQTEPAASAARTGGAGGASARDGGGLDQTHLVGNNFATKAALNDSAADSDTFYTIDNVATRFGVSPRIIAQLFDRLDPDAGERITQRTGAIIATPSGIEKISLMLADAMRSAEAPPAPSSAPETANTAAASVDTTPTSAPAKMPATANLTVVRVRGHKRITAALPSGATVVCEVQRTDNFLPGMTLKACVRGWGNIYRFTGKLPRRKGRW